MASTHKLWFKRKRYGYGWTPSSWQGWLVIVMYLAIVLAGGLLLEGTSHKAFTKELVIYILIVILASLALLRITNKKGPAPKWRWGRKNDDDSSEDY